MSRIMTFLLGVIIAIGMVGCESTGYGGEIRVGRYPDHAPPPPPPPSRPSGQPTVNGVKVAHLGIPPGHLPPPGMCRVWYPGKPPGHQPRPGTYEQLAYSAPAGAWLIIRPADRPNNVVIHDYTNVRAVHYHNEHGNGKGKGGKGKGKGLKSNQKAYSSDPYIYRPGSGVSGEVVLTPEGGQVSVRVYDADTGVYVGARVPVG